MKKKENKKEEEGTGCATWRKGSRFYKMIKILFFLMIEFHKNLFHKNISYNDILSVDNFTLVFIIIYNSLKL
jgi:hypothetical protein